VQRHKKEGVKAYKIKKSGRPKLPLNPKFVDKVIKIRKDDDYGSEKIHFVHEYPVALIDEQGQVRIWYPDFFLPFSVNGVLRSLSHKLIYKSLPFALNTSIHRS